MTDDEIKRIINSRLSMAGPNRNPNLVIRKQQNRGRSILITGGIGDFIALEPYILSQRTGISQIYLATRGSGEIAEIVRKAYPEVTLKNVVPNFPRHKYSFISYEECFAYMREKKIRIPSDFTTSQDCSILKIFPQIEKNGLEHMTSRLLLNEFTNIKNFCLPEKYVAMVSASLRDAIHASRGRNLLPHEITNIKSRLTLPIVCIYCECKQRDPDIIHLPKTNIFESIEILKNSCGYVGIDSWLSVVAGWIFDEKKMVVKCINEHGIRNKNCYWPKLRNPSFLYENLGDSFIFET